MFFNTHGFQKTLKSIPLTRSLEVFLLWVFVFQVSLLGAHSDNLFLLQSSDVVTYEYVGVTFAGCSNLTW